MRLRGTTTTCALALASAFSCGARSGLIAPAPHDAARAVDGMPPPTLRALAITAGTEHVCARMSDGTVRCWGDNEHGQLGDGGRVNRAHPATVLLPDGASLLAAGGNHTCGQAPGGAVFCWGDDQRGELADGTSGQDYPTPVRVAIDGVVQIALGSEHTMFRMQDGSAATVGDNRLCQLGASPRGPSDANLGAFPAAIDGSGTIASITAGETYSCVIYADGRLRCAGALDPMDAVWCAPNDVAGLQPTAEAAFGNGYVCARSVARSVDCRGQNDEGQLGDGTRNARVDWGRVALPAQAARLFAGGASTCALLDDAALWCWGRNLPTNEGATLVPTQVLLPESVVEMAMESASMCALGRSGRVYCWGVNGHGELGRGTFTSYEGSPGEVGFE